MKTLNPPISQLTSAQIRSAFLSYFQKNGHSIVASSSLVPDNDPTLLYTNAGMNQFKNLFLGLEQRDYVRAATSQKCVRAGGKHNDLDNVGFTARHHTFFEMLGNFSFGDYFKKDAIHFAWELLTKELQIPKDKLYVTVFQSDDEAADIWHKQEGVPRDRIFRFGEKDNFWRMGDTGPCGPCSEIFFDHGPKAGKETDPFKGIAAGEDRFIEIWNLVFMQFFEKAPDQLEPLPKPSVDTGAGLERVVAALQGHNNNYDTDLFSSIIETASRISGVEYIQDQDLIGKDISLKNKTSALRVLADHSRSVGFLLADGVLPSNEGRGYVLRRIMRRAIRFGRKLSTSQSIFPATVNSVIDLMGNAYPELLARREHVLSVVKDEETRFLHTLDQGTEILMGELQQLKKRQQSRVPGEVVFKLYDTYGFPVDLTRVMAEESGFQVNDDDFNKEMEKARTKAKASWKGKAMSIDEAHKIQMAQEVLHTSGATQFKGYEGLTASAKVLRLSDGHAGATQLQQGQDGLLVTDATPFYAEGGGQVGDQGEIKTASGSAIVHNTTKVNDIFLHHIEVTSGVIQAGSDAKLVVNESLRRQTMSNHSATHLMHSALRKVLGSHVTQAGSSVDAEKTRFDFTHNKPLTPEELEKVEDLVNEQISLALPVSAQVMGHKEALQKGAMALFGEKYGDQVRVLTMGDFSCELCGGTHVSNTAQIRLFKIVAESGVSAGVRRIEALTGRGALEYLNKHLSENQKARGLAGIQESWMQFLQSSVSVSDVLEKRREEIKVLEKEIRQLKGSQIDLEQILSRSQKILAGSAQLIVADVSIDDRDVLAQLADQLKNRIQSGVVVVLGQSIADSHPLIVSVTKDLNPKISAGNLLKEAAQQMGGRGGGRPDFAQGAVPNRGELPKALEKLTSLLN